DQGWTVIEACRDTVSGFTLERTSLDRVRGLAQTGAIEVVLAHALDRVSRKQTHVAILVEEMEEAGVELDFVTEDFEDTAVGQLVRSVKAFAAEFEREKIAERTMRGKLARAAAGKLPQGTGKGCYGYIYNRGTGHREIEPAQAEIVRRTFQRYAETRSFSAVARELNADAVPAFGGGKWYPSTVRRLLMNPSYVGRPTYRRLQRTRNGLRARPREEWITIKGAAPALVDEALWSRVQAVLDDPERTRPRQTTRHYLLRSRVRCARCDAAMVGQTQVSKGRDYRYYRCRHAYNSLTKHSCEAKYVRGDRLEARVWDEVRRVLSDPTIVLDQLRHHYRQNGGEDGAQVSAEVTKLAAQEQRLVRLYGLGQVDEGVVIAELQAVRERREALDSRSTPVALPDPDRIDDVELNTICQGVLAWLDDASEADREQVLEALQIRITASPEEAEMVGVLPVVSPEFVSVERSSRCSSSGDQ
ncbi:MAG: recombinase family protein, partial [Chloroflexi bacterium]|nr:recombinase family protein [Chloroflexota bacterium]